MSILQNKLQRWYVFDMLPVSSGLLLKLECKYVHVSFSLLLSLALLSLLSIDIPLLVSLLPLISCYGTLSVLHILALLLLGIGKLFRKKKYWALGFVYLLHKFVFIDACVH
jgi:hypothetical protein